jgi:hypothetical protein
MELDSILKGETPTETEAEKAERLRDDKGRFAKGETETVETKVEPEPKAETPAAPEKRKPDPEFVPLKAVQEERRKRQELERRLQELETQRNPPPNLQEDPNGYQAHLQQTLQSSLLNERLNLSESMVRDKHGDEAVEEAQELFGQAAQQDPALVNKLYSERNPYGWLMKWAKSQKLTKEMGDDPDTWISQKEAEIRAKVEQEIAQKYQRPTPPPSLASAHGGRVESTPAWSGPSSLDSILKR